MVSIRYESSLNSYLTRPFENGIRHLKVAFCDGTQETLTQMAKERIIYRARESDHNLFYPLTKKQRVYHALLGLSETVGYASLILPFIATIPDEFYHRPFYPKGGYPLRTHMQEGGEFHTDGDQWRKNPFDSNGKEDPFYQGASWIKAEQTQEANHAT